ncbi:MAG: 50S ribosomal protein L5 [Planctomycetes bacterium]|jgi:large subunit ribosomal protein L5|nr:50S ribosomal protein L5 [Planctomycetota bacterium]
MRLKELYKKEIISELKKHFSIKNPFLVPKVQKVVVNVGFGRFAKEKAYIEEVVKILTKITGQKVVLTKAKKSISSFKIREGMTIGAMSTLRGNRMYDFLDKLVNLTFPRVRDFRGLSEKSIDKTGNFTIGIKEIASFSEVKPEDVTNNFGLEVCIATTAKKREEAVELFRLMGFPFKKN